MAKTKKKTQYTVKFAPKIPVTMLVKAFNAKEAMEEAEKRPLDLSHVSFVADDAWLTNP